MSQTERFFNLIQGHIPRQIDSFKTPNESIFLNFPYYRKYVRLSSPLQHRYKGFQISLLHLHNILQSPKSAQESPKNQKLPDLSKILSIISSTNQIILHILPSISLNSTMPLTESERSALLTEYETLGPQIKQEYTQMLDDLDVVDDKRDAMHERNVWATDDSAREIAWIKQEQVRIDNKEKEIKEKKARYEELKRLLGKA